MKGYDFIINRRSIRKYKESEIPKKDLDLILEAANHSPMAEEYQSWKLILVKNKEIKNRIVNLSANQKWVKYASAFVFGIMLNKGDPRWRIIDTSIALENVVLAAEALGYGSCWIGAFEEEEIKKLLQIPKKNQILAYITLGIKDEVPHNREYKNLEEIVYLDKYGENYR